MKPKIKKIDGWWVCEGYCIQGIGADPATAFENWNSQVSGLMRKQGEI